MSAVINIPPSIAKRGITGMTDNLPPRSDGLDIASDFVRIFRPEIEARVLGFGRTAPAPAPRPAGADFSGAQP